MAIIAKNIIVGGENKSPPKPVEKPTVKPVKVISFKEATIVRETPVVSNNDHYHIVIDNDLEKRYHKRSAYQSDMIDLK